MTKLIAETAWHHEGDFHFMKSLIADICQSSDADIVKMHITLDFDEYMLPDHEIYTYLKSMLFSREQWAELIDDVKISGKDILVLVNDRQALDFVMEKEVRMIEVHASLLGDLDILRAINAKTDNRIGIVLGVGGATLEEVDLAINVLETKNIILMFGFQNFPTKYSDINFNKVRNIIRKYPGYRYGYADHTAWDEANNIIISLMGSAIGMDFLEKHVTNHYGVERLDWQSTISVDMCREIARNISLLNKCNGEGGLELNEAEKSYSVYGPMKKAIVLKHSVSKGDAVNVNDFAYRRTSVVSDVQVTSIMCEGKYSYDADLSEGHVLLAENLCGIN